MATLDWAVEVWNLPHNSPHEIILGDLPDLSSVSYATSAEDGGDVTVRLPADDPNLDVICDPDASPPVSTLLRVYLNRGGVRFLQGGWLAERRSRPFEDDENERWVEISGPHVDDVATHGAVPTYDYPESPSSAPDWVFGGESNAGSFTNGTFEDFGTEVISNGGFESGTLDGWNATSTVGGPGVNDVRVSSLRAETGGWSCFVDPLNVVGSGIRSDPISVAPGGRYLLQAKILQPTTITPDGNRWTLRIKTGSDVTINNPGAGGVFRVGDWVYCEIDNAAKGAGATILGGLAPNDDTVWQGFTIDVTMGDFRENPDDTTQETFVELAWESGDAGSPPVYFDSVTMIQTSGDGLEPWKAFTPATVPIAVETVDVRTGARALRFTANAFTGEGFPTGVQQLVTELTAGDPYTFGAWVYNKQGTTRKVRLHLRQEGSSTIASTDLSIPGLTYAFASVTAVAPLSSLLAEVRVHPDEEPNLPLAFVVDDATFSGGVAAASPGDITLQLLAAIQARGRLTYLTATTFTATTDSDGNAWDDPTLSVTIPRGQTLAGWLTELSRWGYEHAIEWDGTNWDLRLWNPGDRGAVVAAGIVEGHFTPAGHVNSEIPHATSIFAEGGGGIIDDSVTDAALETALGPRDRYVYAEDVSDVTSLTSRATGELARASRYSAAGRVTLDGDADNLPGIDFGIGDTIEVDLDDLTGPQRVHAYSAELTDRGATFVVEVNDRAAEDATLASIALNRILEQFQRQRTTAGAAIEATPATTTEIVVQGPWAIVAAANAPQGWRDAAGFLCDGINDEVQIRAAIQSFADQNVIGTVLLSPGTFYCGAINGGAVLSGRVINLDPNADPDVGGCVAVIGAGSFGQSDGTDLHGVYSATHLVIATAGGTTGGALAPIRIKNGILESVNARITGTIFTAGIDVDTDVRVQDVSLHTATNVGMISLLMNPESLVDRFSVLAVAEAFRLNNVQGSTFRKITVRGASTYVFNFALTNGGSRTGPIANATFEDVYIVAGGAAAGSAVFRVTVNNGQSFSRNAIDKVVVNTVDFDSFLNVLSPTTAFLRDNWLGAIQIPDRTATPLLTGADAQRAVRRTELIPTTTAGRPPAADVIYEWRFDTDLGHPIVSDGTNWIDALGTTV